MKLFTKTIALVFAAASLLGCTGKPDNVEPVSNFNLTNYLGDWYEVARLDHSFERGLTKVSANYSMNDDGSVKVINRGFNEEEQEWSEAEGKARFIASSDIAHLKVSFFGPFYGSYVVFYLEDDYSVALVSGYNSDYFWILSRESTISDSKLADYIDIAKQAGFNTEALLFPNK